MSGKGEKISKFFLLWVVVARSLIFGFRALFISWMQGVERKGFEHVRSLLLVHGKDVRKVKAWLN